MRATMIAAITVATLLVPVGAVRAQSQATASEHADEVLAATLWRIAVATDTRIGFQSIEPVNPAAGALRDVLVEAARDAATSALPHTHVINTSLEAALDAAIDADPRYEWRWVGSHVVVRPASAWSDAQDALNRPVRQFRTERATDIELLRGISSVIHTGRYVAQGGGGTFVPPFSVESGSVVDVLNALIESADLPFWQAGYRLQPEENRAERWDLSLILTKSTGLQSASSSHRPTAAQ